MSMPSQEEINKMLDERPGDEIYPDVKQKVDYVDDKEKEHRKALVDLVMEDLIKDLAIANSLDSIGVVLNYLAEKRQIVPPTFDGDILMRSFGRIARLKISLDYAEMIGIDSDAREAVLKAEIERLWGDTSAALLKKILLSKAVQPTQAQQVVETGVKHAES